MREKFIKSHLENVDLFLSPSRFLRQRYIEWGIPAERISVRGAGPAADGPGRPSPRRSGRATGSGSSGS